MNDSPGAGFMRLSEARQQCHHAIQLNTLLARACVPAQANDSHTSLEWAVKIEALAGRPVAVGAGSMRLALRPGRLEFTLVDDRGREIDTFALDGRRFEDARNWLAGHLRACGIDSSLLWSPLHFKLEDHPVAQGAPFSTAGREAEFQELAGYYRDASSILTSIAASDRRASAVRCWPHHFDIATLLTLEGSGEAAHTIGVGMSPGDGGYDEPYYYVTPWPYPEPASLPALISGGFWHTTGWVGAVLLADGQGREVVQRFLSGTLIALTKG